MNSRKNQIIELSARVILSKRTPDGRSRTYQELSLERQKVAIFPLAWTIVHPIGESSPLWGQTAEDLEQCEAEFLVLLTGFDETFSQTVHARSSYRVHEVRFGARFSDMFDRDADDGVLKVDLERIHDVEPVPL